MCLSFSRQNRADDAARAVSGLWKAHRGRWKRPTTINGKGRRYHLPSAEDGGCLCKWTFRISSATLRLYHYFFYPFLQYGAHSHTACAGILQLLGCVWRQVWCNTRVVILFHVMHMRICQLHIFTLWERGDFMRMIRQRGVWCRSQWSFSVHLLISSRPDEVGKAAISQFSFQPTSVLQTRHKDPKNHWKQRVRKRFFTPGVVSAKVHFHSSGSHVESSVGASSVGEEVSLLFFSSVCDIRCQMYSRAVSNRKSGYLFLPPLVKPTPSSILMRVHLYVRAGV